MRIYLLNVLVVCGLFLMTACQNEQNVQETDTSVAPAKSELVQRLEDIFYTPEFAAIPARDFLITDYGAIGDGKTLNTEAIQRTIDAATAKGGGRVVVPAGTFVSGALFLKSNVELHLTPDAVIQAIQSDAHFADKWTRVAGIEMDWPAALVNIYEEENVRITGKGVIDGNGKFWWDKFWGDPPRTGGMWTSYKKNNVRWALDYDCKRVRPVVVYKSKNVMLKDFTVKRAGFWTVSLTYSERVYVDGVIIRNNIGGFGPSSDGVNTDSSKDVLVENCDIDCNDDNLCIKAGRDSDGLRVDRPAENIVYRNCVTRAGHGLFTIGSETSGGMRNVEVYGLKAQGTSTGIRFKSAKVRGGLIENIYFHDIEMEDVKKPFQFELNWYPEYSYPVIPDSFIQAGVPRHWEVMATPVEPAEKGIPEFRNIRLSNIEVKGAERGFYANAYPEMPIHDLHWENVTVEALEGGTLNYAKDWTMENVILVTRKNAPIMVTHSEKVDLPSWEYEALNQQGGASQGPVLKQLAALQQAEPGTTLVPVNMDTEMLIAAGDTTTAATHMALYVLNGTRTQMEYLEPLGDGFYFSPVKIWQHGSTLRVEGQKAHEWTIYLSVPQKPAVVSGVDEWQYQEEQQLVVAKKSGMQFEVVVER